MRVICHPSIPVPPHSSKPGQSGIVLLVLLVAKIHRTICYHVTPQVDVIGVNVQDIIHPQDCSEVIRIFQTQGQDSEQGIQVFKARTKDYWGLLRITERLLGCVFLQFLTRRSP